MRALYETWGRELRERDPGLRFRVARYPLFNPSIDTTPAQYFEALSESLAVQLQDFYAESEGGVRIVAHSFGGYLALKLLERSVERVEACYLLHPFLRQPGARGRALLRTVYALNHLPSIGDGLVGIRPFVGRFLKEARQITPEEISVFLQIAHYEHLGIVPDRSELRVPPELGAKLRVYSHPRDTWCPPESLRSLGPGVRHVVGAASHNFILRRPERDLVADFLRAPA